MPFDNDEVMAQLVNAADASFELRAVLATTTGFFDAIKDRANLGDYGSQVTQAGLLGVPNVGSYYASQVIALLDPVWRNALRLAGFNGAGNIRQQFGRIYRYLHENRLTFTPRGVQYGSSKLNTFGRGAADAIVGNVLFRDLTVDRYGYPLDSGWPEARFGFRCVQSGGARTSRFSELFQFTSPQVLDFFSRGGVGESGAVTMVNDGGGILQNHDFKIGNAANATPTTLGAWLDDSGITGTAYELTTRSYRLSARELVDGQIGLSLLMKANRTLYQPIQVDINRSIPLLATIAIYRPSGADKRIRVRLGSKTLISVQLDTLVADAWNLVIATPSVDCWPDNFLPVDGTDLRFEIELDNGTGSAGTPEIGQVELLSPFQLNGRFAWLINQTIPSSIEDYFEIFDDDFAGTPGRITRIVQESFLLHLPTVKTATPITAAGGRTFTFDAATKTITLSTGSLISDNYERNQALVIAGTTDNNGTKTIVSVTATTIVVAETLVDEGPLSATATLNAGPTVADPT